MFDGLPLVVALADLLFNFFGHQIDGGVEIILPVFGEQIRSANAQLDRATELFFRYTGMIMLQRDPRIHNPLIHVVQLVELGNDVVFNGFCQRDIVRGKNQFHV